MEAEAVRRKGRLLMFAFLLVSTITILGYLCVGAGFLIILASVLFVIKGKAVLGDSGAPNEVTWGKMKLNLTSAVFLFVLGAVMIVLPFWRFQELDAQLQVARARLPNTVTLSGSLISPKDIRVLLVVKPDYDQIYRNNIKMQVPLVGTKATYAVLYVDGDKILNQESFSVKASADGSEPPEVNLNGLTVLGNTQEIVPRKEVSDAELKKLGIH